MVYQLQVPGQFEVQLRQRASGTFQVVYGAQLVDHLDYTAAAHEFGECAMHAMGCAGLLDSAD